VSLGRAALAAALAASALLAAPGGAAPPPAPPPPAEDDPADLVNGLLAGLLGFTDATEEELERQVADVGGVPFKSDVRVEYMGRGELARYIAELLDAEYPAEQADRDRRLLEAFDFLPAGSDLRALRARVLEENVVGFYDERPAKRRLFVVSADKTLTPMTQMVIVHELRHALQDQYIGVYDKLDPAHGDFDDRRMAFLSLLEGDATFVMERFLTRKLPEGNALAAAGEGSSLFGMGAMAAAAVPNAPPVIRDQLIVPYFAGRDFVAALFREGGWARVRQAWERPPVSSEQVLHPEKFLRGENPVGVPLPPAPSGGRVLRSGVLGEALLRTWLGDGGEAAAAGWGGDAFQVLDVRGKTLLTWRALWDGPADADEFYAAAEKRLERTHGPPRVVRGRRHFGRGRYTMTLERTAGGCELRSSDDPSLL
jgi:hypothetical protein